MPTAPLQRRPFSLRSFLLRQRRTVLPALVILAIAASVHILVSKASIPGGLGPSSDPNVRTCSDAGTVFEGKRLLQDVIPLYHTTVAAVVAEREEYLSTSSQWDCEEEPAMPRLMALATREPGWHYPVLTSGMSSVTYLMRPVTFDAFSSILGEFLREYECKLLDMEGQASIAITQGEDLGSLCTTGPCPELSSGDVAVRIDSYIQFLQNERHRARVALERTLHALRSFDVQYDAARSLLCYERAALDLRNEMSLLADATSCMPKIWDTVTSLHDRKEKP